MRRQAALWIPALCASMLASCETSTSTQEPRAELQGAWALQALELVSGQTIRVSDPSQYTLEFRGDEVGLRVDCNSCGGGYEISGNELRLGNLACLSHSARRDPSTASTSRRSLRPRRSPSPGTRSRSATRRA